MSEDNLPTILDGAGDVPEHLKQYAQKAAEEAGNLVTSFLGLPAISIRGKQFRWKDNDDKETVLPAGQSLDVVILATDPPIGTSKAYYAGAYTPGSDEAPDCTSADGVRPDSYIDSPQCRSCAECPHNAWGSGTKSDGSPSAGKACQDNKNIYVINADHLDGCLSGIRVPPMSQKSLSKLGKKLGKGGVPMQGVVVTLSFEDAEHPQLEFTAKRYLDAAETAIAMARAESDELQDALPSKNQPERSNDAPALEAPAADTALPAPPAPDAEPVKTMTEKAGGTPYDEFIAKGWTDDQLVEHGYMTIN